MKKKKIKVWLPVYASALFECEVDIDTPEDELFDYFTEYCEVPGSLCHYCSNRFETDPPNNG